MIIETYMNDMDTNNTTEDKMTKLRGERVCCQKRACRLSPASQVLVKTYKIIQHNIHSSWKNYKNKELVKVWS